jgi:hypothetical protein
MANFPNESRSKGTFKACGDLTGNCAMQAATTYRQFESN